MQSIADALGAHATSMEIYDATGSAPPVVAAPRTDPEWLQIYRERWSPNIVRQRSLALMPVGVPFRCDQLVPRSLLERSSFYNEFWMPQRINLALLMVLAHDGKADCGAGFYRSWKQAPFASEDERFLMTLGPHLRRAVALNLRLGRLEMERHSSAEMLNRCDHGAILVDESARKVLPLRAETAWLTQRPVAIIFVEDPKIVALPSQEDIRVLFDLTRAQSALAREILRGDGVQAAADRLNIARATARTHLLEIFQKTGTSRQAELVRVILQRSVAMRAAQLTPSTRREPSPLHQTADVPVRAAK
jgi:DNA-binding CsgD family transcriptional regulator